jgi:hypothetical protein
MNRGFESFIIYRLPAIEKYHGGFQGTNERRGRMKAARFPGKMIAKVFCAGGSRLRFIVLG